MLYEKGYVYHIKDEFFKLVNDDYLMANKENGNYRPTYFCCRDEDTSLLWMIPMSTRTEKFQAIYDKQVKKYGKCITIVMGEFDGKKAAFLLQNMFPITDYYLDHIHTKNGNPVPVNSEIQKVIYKDFQKLRQLLKKNKKVVFPDVKKIEKIMLHELENHNPLSKSSTLKLEKENTPFNNLLIEIKKTDITPQKVIERDPDR